MDGPLGRHEVLCNRTKRLVDIDLVFDIGTTGTTIELAESTKGENEIDAADMTRIVNGGGLVIHIIDDLVEFSARIDRPVEIEAIEIDIDDGFEHGAVFG
jgi:hypothetical protein